MTTAAPLISNKEEDEMIPATATGGALRRNTTPRGQKSPKTTELTADNCESILAAFNTVIKEKGMLTLRIAANAEMATNGYSHNITTPLTPENVFHSLNKSTVVIRTGGLVAVPMHPTDLLVWATQKGKREQPGCIFVRRR